MKVIIAENGNLDIIAETGLEALSLRDWEREHAVGSTIKTVRYLDRDDTFKEFIISLPIHLAKRGTKQTVCGLETTAEYTGAVIDTYLALNPKTKKNDLVKMTLEKHAVDCPFCKDIIKNEGCMNNG